MQSTSSTQKEGSGNLLVKENLMVKKQLQALKKFNTAGYNRTSYGSFSLNNSCEPNLNGRKYRQVIIIAGGIEGTGY
jgi:hypothetical protein